MRRRRAPQTRLIVEPPRTVAELARSLRIPLDALARDGDQGTGLFPGRPPAPDDRGPLSDSVGGVMGRYRFDLYHERPLTLAVEIGARELLDYRLFFRSGRERWEHELRRHHADASLVGGRRRYGPFFVDDGADDRFELEWYSVEPDWATPPVDEVARSAALRVLAAGLASATADRVDQAVETLPPTAGVRAVGASGDSTIDLVFEPPMPASLIADAFGFPVAVAATIDVHMSMWRVAVPAPPGIDRLRAGRWEVEALLTGGATGTPAEDLTVPAGLVRHLAATDVVRVLRIR